jgi:DNA polymerase-1
MPIVYSDVMPTDRWQAEQWYNTLDCCVTVEIHEALAKDPAAQATYAFERGLQGILLDMMLTGFRIDPHWRTQNIIRLEREGAFLPGRLDRIAEVIWGKGLNPNSPKQLLDFFYSKEIGLGLPEVWISQKGVRKLSTNREALEKLELYYVAQPFINCIFAIRQARKQLGVLRAGVDADGLLGQPGLRMRCTYNPTGTETGRLASSQNVWGRGTNLQNITDELRRTFVADLDHFLLYVDGEQAESRYVGFIHGELFDDWTYLDACEAGDLHTSVTKLVWPLLAWQGTPKGDREVAEQPFYRWFSYRDMAKRGGHGTNYYGQPPTMAKHLKVPKELIEEFQRKYFSAFPAMKRWHTWVSGQLGRTSSITTAVGRERTFFDRPNDDATLRKAIAFEPQSGVADIINEGGIRVWRKFPNIKPLAQIHDAYIFQIPGTPDTQAPLIQSILETFQVPIRSRRRPDRVMIIPSEAKVGWNWGSCELDKPIEKRTHKDGNPDGLRKWKGRDGRTRSEDPEAPMLDRVIL